MDRIDECISMEEQIPAGPDTHRFDKLVKWLGLKDQQKNRAAIILLSRLGRPGMELLVEEAAGPGKQPDHRVAILDLVARIGEPLGPTEFFTLQSMLRHKVSRVAEKAAEVFAALSPVGIPKSAEDVALFRTFHPAFWTLPCRSRSPSSALAPQTLPPRSRQPRQATASAQSAPSR